MQYAQVKTKLNMTLRATFIVAFFASLFANAIQNTDAFASGDKATSGIDIIDTPMGLCMGLIPRVTIPKDSCESQFTEQSLQSVIAQNPMGKSFSPSSTMDDIGNNSFVVNLTITFSACLGTNENGQCDSFVGRTNTYSSIWSYSHMGQEFNCPSAQGDQSHTSNLDLDKDGNDDACAHPDDVAEQQAREDLADEECQSLVVDSGNNTQLETCYTPPHAGGGGTQCNLTHISSTTDGTTNLSYYAGSGAAHNGCEAENKPRHDNAGTGSTQDLCVTGQDGSLYCQAQPSDHCGISQGQESCDSGCISDDAGNYMCDASLHPDLLTQEATPDDFFNSEGQCSVIAGSAYKGACEELGGEWQDESEYEPTSCPRNTAGTCSVDNGSGSCFVCTDLGGVWTPDPDNPPEINDDGIDNLAHLMQKQNQKLDVAELSTRKSAEKVSKSVEAGSKQITDQLRTMTNTLKSAIEDQESPENQDFSITKLDVDKSLLNSMFDTTSITTLQAEQTQLKTDIQTSITNITNEAKAMFVINVTSTGYENRTLDLTYGSFDLSLSRLQQFFLLLGGVVMFAAAVYSLVIILGTQK